MPTRIEVNVTTGVVTEIELEGDELTAYEESLAAQENAPNTVPAEPTLAEIVAQLQAEVMALKGNQT